MKRQSPPKAAASIALFPFLAVLLCTMGGLIILLVVIARQAKQQAAVNCQASIEARGELELRRSDAEWRNDHLRASRDKTAADLAERREDISHLEDHARRLRDQLAELARAVADFDHYAAARDEDTANMRGRLNEVQQQLRVAEEETASNQRARPKNESYAVIPYAGPHQTHRRPIYIECRADSIILQPEGIELIDSDFFGPPGPSNPLAAALRAARQYLVSTSDADPAEHGDPYPLLLVRPDGILSYYTAREAMSSWGADFGYEFVDADWKLTYKPPDPNMILTVARAIDDARRRQATLAVAAPRLTSSRQQLAYREMAEGQRTITSGANSPSASGASAPGGSQSLGQQTASPPTPGYGQPPAVSSPTAIQQGSAVDRPRLNGMETEGRAYASQSRVRTTDLNRGADGPPMSEEVRTPKRSIASSRGKDWSLPEDHRSAVAVTRPIFVRCYEDHLVVLNETSNGGESQVIALDYRTQDAVDALVGSVHQRINSWGLPGRGTYWRPTLVVEVAANGRGRFADLRELLTDSGLELREKTAETAVETAPARY
ncbi:MAG TPA: hypothetical protein VHY20_15550 [Pirellulales bacterium]|nr:hypothetical protein [Pirellulales bacterium]